MDLGQMAVAVITFVVIAIVIAIGATIIEEVQSSQTGNLTAYNVSSKGLSGMKTFGDWLPTIATVVAAAVVIGVIVTYFAFSGGRR